MKIAELDNPVRASWLSEQGSRLAARPYVSAAYAARAFLRSLPRTETLHEVTGGRIFNASRFGIAVIKGGIYGTSVRHIEPHHIADLPVPRLGDQAEGAIVNLQLGRGV